MSRVAVLVTLFIAVVLAFATYFALRRPQGPEKAEPIRWLSGLDEHSVDFLYIRDEAFSAEIRRDRAVGAWVMRQPKELGDSSWPVTPERVRGTIRLLGELSRSQEEAAPPIGTKVHVTIGAEAKWLRKLEFGGAALGGRCAALIETDSGMMRPTRVDDSLRRVFTAPGVREWRRPMLIPREGVDPSRIRLTSGQGSVTLSRLKGRWFVIEPVSSPADESVVQSLVSRLSQIPVARFEDAKPEGVEARVTFDDSASTAILETELRDDTESGKRRVLVEEVRVGPAADVARSTVFVRGEARLRGSQDTEGMLLWGPSVMVVERARLDAVSTDPTVYILATASRVPVADVGRIIIESETESRPGTIDMIRTTYTRTLDGWTRETLGEPERLLTPEEASNLASMVKLILEQRCKGVVIRDDAKSSRKMSVTLAAPDGSPIERHEIGVSGTGGEARFVIRSGEVTRVYDEKALKAMEWLDR